MLILPRTRTILLTLGVLAISRTAAQAQDPADGLALPADCVKLLQAEDAKIKTAGATKALLAWTPLIVLAGESNAVQLAQSISNLPWNELAEALPNVNKLLYTNLATEALWHAHQHEDDPGVEQFWKKLSDAYARKAGLQ
jgi:hypothetical protein